MALKWTDLDIKRRIIHVQRSVWRGRKVAEVHETVPKGGKGRKVTMTGELAAALAKHRNLRDRVLTTDDGQGLTNKIVRTWFERAQRAAGLEVTGAIHRLRHTFCSMLASDGAPTGAIQKLAGHTRLSSQRFDVPALSMHDGLYVSRLTSTGTDLVRGDILETEKMHASTRKLVLG